MSSTVFRVSDEVWTKIFLFCGYMEVLRLELTCKFFRYIIYDKAFWLLRLRALEQDEAPNLPRHIPISTLTVPELRTLVIRAHRRHLNCTGPAPLRPTREITGPICPPDSGLRENCPELLPGGALLLIRWMPRLGPRFQPSFLQCFNVPGGKCIWTHQSDGLEVRRFDYDMQANGDVRVLTESSPPNPQMGNIVTGSQNNPDFTPHEAS
ncbi:hypothetical protein DFH11DRAFT_1730928 [Phellopilus nigrolimitatus]|nr:hypothetical protein DFH11DRAFT_1730928 [Phellopilus nigrolimitatus]